MPNQASPNRQQLFQDNEDNELMLPVADALISKSPTSMFAPNSGKLTIHEQAVYIVENQLEIQKKKTHKQRFCIGIVLVTFLICFIVFAMHRHRATRH